jgi:uncharacterized protein YhfF
VTIAATEDGLERFWTAARAQLPERPAERPEAWAFGAAPQPADELIALVLDGTKTATASSFHDDEADDEELPVPGLLNIILDGSGAPRAILETTDVRVVPFDEVDEAHARAEGEDDRTLQSWRGIHSDFWTRHSRHGFDPDMPVVCERFRLILP